MHRATAGDTRRTLSHATRFNAAWLFNFPSRASALSRDSMRAEPNITIVSPMPSFFSCTSGCKYSVKMRIGRAAVLSRNAGSLYGANGACIGGGFQFFEFCPGWILISRGLLLLLFSISSVVPPSGAPKNVRYHFRNR